MGGSGGNGGGGGYGGAGGRGTDGDAYGGGTYTPPQLFGSSGASGSGSRGGAGGGKILIDVTNAFILNGSILANGGNGTGGTYNAGGGGSGGSIYVTTVDLSGSGILSSNGGTGYSTYYYGGGGGGGRVYYGYITKDFAGSCTANGGTGYVSGTSISCNPEALDDPPVISSIDVSPPTPSVSTPVVISTAATDDLGINEIKISVDDGGGYVLKRTCTFSASLNASCSTPSETYARGSYTVKVEVKDTANQTTTDTSTTFGVSAQTTVNQPSLASHIKDDTTTFGLSFVLAGDSTGTLTVNFPSGFVLSNPLVGPTSASGCLSNPVRDSDTTFHMTKTACSGTVSLSGVEVTNPGTPGSYVITWSNDNGSGAIYIIDDDSVTISANVDATLTFDLDVATSDADTDDPYELGLGVLSTLAVIGSDDSSVPGIWVDLSTNASLGAIVTVSSANAGLESTSVPADAIPSGAVSIGSEGYGLCVASGGLGVPSATAGTFQGVNFTGTCSDSSWTVATALTSAPQTIFNTSGAPVDGGRGQIRTTASISTVTPAHSDYSDTLTFIATATF